MKSFERNNGKKADCRAEIHEYRDGTPKIEIEVPLEYAKSLLERAVGSGGVSPVTLIDGHGQIDGSAIAARIDSFDENGRRVGGTGVIAFGSLKPRT